MGFYEKEWLKSEQEYKIRYCYRYVVDIFCMVENEIDTEKRFNIS